MSDMADYNAENLRKIKGKLFPQPEPVDDLWQEFDEGEDPPDH